MTTTSDMRERIRCATINAAGAVHGRRDLADEAILRGYSVASFERDLLKDLSEPLRPAGAIGLTEKEIQQYSFCRWLDAISRGSQAANETFESECTRAVADALNLNYDGDPKRLLFPLEIIHRDLNVATQSAGGYLTDASRVVSFDRALRAASVVGLMGVTRLRGLRGTSSNIARISADATAEWLTDEADAPTESQQTFANESLTPKSAAVYCEISRQLVKQSVPAIEALLFQDLGRLMGQVVDIAVVNGTGAGGRPLGVLGISGVGAFAGASLGYDALVDAQLDVAIGDAILDPLSLGYLTTPEVAALLKSRQRFTGTDSPLWKGAIHAGEVEGVAAMSSTVVPTSTMLYGDWSNVVLGEWGVLEVEANPYAQFAMGGVGFRAFWTVDVALRHRAGFSIATSIT